MLIPLAYLAAGIVIGVLGTAGAILFWLSHAALGPEDAAEIEAEHNMWMGTPSEPARASIGLGARMGGATGEDA